MGLRNARVALLLLVVFLCQDADADQVVATRTANGWMIYSNYELTNDRIDKAKAGLNVANNVLESDYTFWHWTSWNNCIRRAATQISQGEMEYLVNNDSGMRVGGGLYLARLPKTSSDYGPCPLNVVIKAGTPKYSSRILSNSAGISILSDRAKASLGTVIPYIHQYDLENDWWVTHSTQNIVGVDIGVKTWKNIPWWGTGGQANYLVRPPYMNAIKLWDTIDGPNGIVNMMKKEMGVPAGDGRFNNLDWLKAFFILMQYIDGPSLVRAIRQFPTDPWSVFEPQKFGFYRDAWLAFVNGRLQNPSGTPYPVFGYTYNIAQKGKFGDGTSTWATRQVNEVLPNLAKLLSGSSAPFAFRTSEVRAGGDEADHTFIATPGQVTALQANPYLVVNANKQPDGNYLVYYYYPDPTHLNPQLQSKVSPALWTKMASTHYSGPSDPQFQADCSKLINELLLDAFKTHQGVDIGVSASKPVDGLSMIIALVSIHPFVDYNGRTTRFYLCAAMFEGAYKSGSSSWGYGDAPVAFISDFDLVTSRANYITQLSQGTIAAGNLRIQMLAEWGRSLNPKHGMADHFALDAWQIYQNEALDWARGGKDVTFSTTADFDLIQHRRFVPLLDSKVGTNWPGRA